SPRRPGRRSPRDGRKRRPKTRSGGPAWRHHAARSRCHRQRRERAAPRWRRRRRRHSPGRRCAAPGGVPRHPGGAPRRALPDGGSADHPGVRPDGALRHSHRRAGLAGGRRGGREPPGRLLPRIAEPGGATHRRLDRLPRHRHRRVPFPRAPGRGDRGAGNPPAPRPRAVGRDRHPGRLRRGDGRGARSGDGTGGGRRSVKRGLMALPVVLVLARAGCLDAESAPTAPAAESTAILDRVLDAPDPEARYLIYLHGRAVEEGGRRPTHPTRGVYEYDRILAALAKGGAVVISEQRPRGTDSDRFAAHVADQARALLRAGVPPERITVAGFSKGGGIAIRASSLLKNPRLNFVFLAACGDGDFDGTDLVVQGRILSIYEANDEI